MGAHFQLLSLAEMMPPFTPMMPPFTARIALMIPPLMAYKRQKDYYLFLI
jgi:hypothetical protein